MNPTARWLAGITLAAAIFLALLLCFMSLPHALLIATAFWLLAAPAALLEDTPNQENTQTAQD